MKVVRSQLAQQMKDLQQKVLRLEKERASSLSRTGIEEELQMQVGIAFWGDCNNSRLLIVDVHLATIGLDCLFIYVVVKGK